MKKIAVVILNYRLRDLTLNCLKSVQKSSYQDFEIIVIDNNSDDGIEQDLDKIPGVVFIQTGKNLGYAGGNNIGIKEGLKRNAEYIFILNPDTIIAKNTIEMLVEASNKSNADILGPKIYFGEINKKIIWYAGGIFDKSNVLGNHRGVNEEDRGQYDKDEITDFVSGAAMFVKSEVFGKIGFFDERYFLYYEDSDFCFRAKRAGFKIIYSPKAIVYHENAKSTGLGSLLQDYFITRNRMLFASKFLSWRTRFALFREGLRNFGNKYKRLALKDFIIGKFGQGGIGINNYEL